MSSLNEMFGGDTDSDDTETEQSQSPSIYTGTRTVIGFDVANGESLTEKQRDIISAFDAYGTEANTSELAQMVGVSRNYVSYVLSEYIDRSELPSDCRYPCFNDKCYSNLTQKQKRVVNELAMNPSLTQVEVAELADCHKTYVGYVSRIYGDIVEQRSNLC